MTWTIRAACAALGLAVFASAAARPPPVEARFQGDNTLLLDFREPVVNWDNAVRSDLVRTTPGLWTTCGWDSDTRLNCRLQTAPAPATRYRIDVAAGLKTQAGATLGARTLHVETARPSAQVVVTRWNRGLPVIDVIADQAVDAAALEAVLRIKLDRKPVAPVLRPLPPAWSGDKRSRFALVLSPVERNDVLLDVAIKPGLRSTAGPLTGQQNGTLLRARLNTTFRLLGVACAGIASASLAPVRAGVATAACAPAEPVHLVFSQPLDTAQRAQVERTAGSAPQTTDRDAWNLRDAPFDDAGVESRPAQWFRIGEPGPSAAIDLQLDAGIRGEDGTALPPVTVRIRTGEAQPQLASRQRALVADTAQVPSLVQAINVGEAALKLDGLGVRAVEAQVTARSPRHGSQPHPVRSNDAEQVLAEGGWVRWTPQQDSASRDWRTSRSIEFAAPAFDLLALSGRREVLAWANAWDRDAPVAGARIELLWREPGTVEPRVISSGLTADDGTVLLKLPDDLVLADAPDDDEASAADRREPAMWMLRAAQHDAKGVHRSVLPLGEVDRSGEGLGAAMPRKAWGVSDRPMYRAGDTVRYRLWQRELDGVHLREVRDTSPVTLRLQHDEEDKVVLEWQATPAADGSLSGELVLPVHLTDATYCLGVPARYSTDGTCFFVGTYRAQDLWAEARTRGGVLRDGDRFTATVRAGYFSGGPAAGAELTRIEASLYPEAIENAYPDYADFRFVDVDDDDTSVVELAGLDIYDALDGSGEARIDVPVVFTGDEEDRANRPAFGLLGLDLEATPEDREGTVARDEATRYARYERYVGLRTQPDWFGRNDPVRLEAVVITAQGKEVPDASVEVSIEYVEGHDRKLTGSPVGRCVLRVRASTPCAFARERTGFYRLTARSEGAAPAVLQRYVWSEGNGLRVDVQEPELTVVAVGQADRPARLLLKQPFARARALVVVSHGGHLLDYRVERIDGNVQELVQPRATQWPGRLQVHALVREAAATRVEAGFRAPARVESLETWLQPVAVGASKPPLSVRFAAATAKPGTRARISLRNDSTRLRTIAVSVMDDALRAQAQRWLPYSDPLGLPGFRESLLLRGDGWVRRHDFSGFKGEAWRWLLPWADAEAASNALRARAQALPAPPAAPSPEHYSEQATSLDRIEVTGSRIKRADLVETGEANAPDPSLRLTREPAIAGLRAGAAVRTHFADTALWLPDVRLAPGESRDFDIDLPDNLTRWRAVAWSADDGGDFAMADAALEVGLPVEARLQAPVRLYPGDTTRVATSVRHVVDAPATARTALSVRAAEDDKHPVIDDVQQLPLSPRGQDSVATVLQPTATGMLELVASASTSAGGDAVAGRIEVASPLVTTRKRQAGWIGLEPLHLPLPAMPTHAHEPMLRVSLLRGSVGLVSEWTRDLRDYPHRCWEQILSRAVGAALALERHDPQWPDAGVAVSEAIDNAAVFQQGDGGFVYFPGMGDHEPDGNVGLTAYTLRAFALLRSLGHPVPERVESGAREFIADVDAPSQLEAARDVDGHQFANLAFARAEQAPEDADELDLLWAQWKRLPLPVQVASAQALARAKHPAAAGATRRLAETAPLRGAARTLRLPRRYDAWMSSAMREQCTLIGLLGEYPQLAAPRVRRELLAGLNDLYAGGVPAVDTQTAAQCLMALRESQGALATPLQARFAIGAREQALSLAAGESRAEWNAGAPGGNILDVIANADATAPASYVAELTYQEDAREAQPAAIGLSIDRRHEVLRDGAWKPLEGQSLREGDWVRITLVVRNSAPREFVALTDDVPGGLQPTDLSLSGVGTADLKRIADEGSYYFSTRKLDARKPKFYAETLPAGQHEVRYFARVGNAGDYLAAPAVAELMYGEATHARTAAIRLRVEAPVSK